ncbi:hypothetical protein EGW08_014664, partial [Elysia chlorotica]
MAESRQRPVSGRQRLHVSSGSMLPATQQLSSSSSSSSTLQAALPSSSVMVSTNSNLHISDVVGSTAGHLSIGQPDDGSVMIPFSSGGLDLLRVSSAGITTVTSPASTSDINAGSAVFTSCPSSSGFVLNGVVDESGNVLFEAVEPDVTSQNQFLHSQLQNQQQHQQMEHVSGMQASSSEISSSRAIDAQNLGLLNFHTGAISTSQPSSASSIIESSGANFPGVSVQSTSTAGLIQALSAVSREMSNSTSSYEVTGSGNFNPSLSDESVGIANTAQVYLTQQQRQQRQQILNIMLGGSVAGNSGVISNTPSVNLHHRRREAVAPSGRRTRGDNSMSSGSNAIAEVMSGLGQSDGSVVTVSLNQQLQQSNDEQQQQQQQQQQDPHHQLWTHPDQGRLMTSQGSVGATLGMHQMSVASEGTTPSSSSQQGAQLLEVSDGFQPSTSVGSVGFQDMQVQFSGMFNQQPPHSAYQVVAPSSSSSFGPVSPEDQSNPYAVISGDSEAVASNPGPSQQQQQQQQHVVVESQAVDSSFQSEQYTLMFDAGSQTLRLQRMAASPPVPDCSVSQSVLGGLEGSEAQPSPGTVQFPSQAYSQASTSHMM